MHLNLSGHSRLQCSPAGQSEFASQYPGFTALQAPPATATAKTNIVIPLNLELRLQPECPGANGQLSRLRSVFADDQNDAS